MLVRLFCHSWRFCSILEDCAVECGVWEQTSCADDEAVQIEKMKTEAGVTWNEVDIDAFTAACDPVYDWIVSENGADPTLHAKIVALVRSYRGSAPPAPPPGEPVTLVYAEVNPLEGTIVGAMAKAFNCYCGA